jgi:hypothetical protein
LAGKWQDMDEKWRKIGGKMAGNVDDKMLGNNGRKIW